MADEIEDFDDENETTSYVEDAINALLDGNRVRFGDRIASALRAKATDAVDALHDDMEKSVFDFEYGPEDEDEVEEENSDPEDELEDA